MTKEVMELIEKARFQGGLVLDDPHETGEEVLLTRRLVGQSFQKKKNKIWECLMEEEVFSIGVYGMGGVGKTTLMTHIHNELLERRSTFQLVYWITVSQDSSIYKLQNHIAKTVYIDLSNEDDVIKRAAKLSNALTRRQKFVLILDDLWNHFPLEKVGIPRMRGCKLIITTRSLDVCWRMNCEQKIKVEPLSKEEAWNLFKEKLGEPFPPKVNVIAKSISEECAGLLLGIITMAGSMRGVDDVCEWRNALAELKESKVREDDMEFEVFQVLKLSYSRLNDSALQQCFLYCSLYPEDYKIRREDLIDYLVSEGIIKEMKSRQAEFDRGHVLLNRLEKVCLLEGGIEYGYRYVKMHDLVRDMAIQIMRADQRVMAEAGADLFEFPHWKNWTPDLVRISLMDNDIEEIPSSQLPTCPNLSTLLLCGNKLRAIPDSFFKQLPGLKILDLSRTQIEALPGSISHLVNLSALLLNECEALMHVPSLAQLRALKKLDLSYTEVEELPQGIEFLSNLKYLDLQKTKLKEFPLGILPKLLHLQVLILDWSLTVKGVEMACLKNLETLQCRFHNMGEFNMYLTSTGRSHLSQHNLVVGRSAPPGYDPPRDWQGVCFFGGCISEEEDALHVIEDVQDFNERRSLCFENASEFKSFQIASFKETEYLDSFFSNPSMFQSIEDLYLSNMEKLYSLFRRGVVPPAPTTAIILSSPSNGAFSCLKTLKIYSCPGMKKLFCPDVLSNLQNLEEIFVYRCENMEELIAVEDQQESHSSNRNQFVFSVQFSLPKLRTFSLSYLLELKSICSGRIICNSLQEISVCNCPKLKRISLCLLLLDTDQPCPLPSLKNIYLSPRKWWESFELDHPNAKNVLLPLCRCQYN